MLNLSGDISYYTEINGLQQNFGYKLNNNYDSEHLNQLAG
jgi:hypothetical protein